MDCCCWRSAEAGKATPDAALGVPKAELHVHIEGTLEAATIFRLARKNDVLGKLPVQSEEEWADRCKHFADLAEFLNLFYAGMECLRGREDFCEMTYAYLARANADSVRHAEIFFDPQPHVARGVSVEDQVSGMEDAFALAKEAFAMTGAIIFCWQRQLGLESAKQTLQLLKPFAGRVVGVGCDSDYVDEWPDRFAPLFQEARAAGFKICGHAGEVPDEGPGDHQAMATFLAQVQPDRVDHGFRCWQDEPLLRQVVERGLHLTVCPLSNASIGCVPSLGEHPVRKLLQAGVSVGLNSDDPAYLGGFIGANYQACADTLGMSIVELCTCSRNAVRASFAPEERKAAILAEIDAYQRQYG